jgi:hypothetical protein
MNYQLIPLERFAPGIEVAELCASLAEGNVSQPIAQAAAWHFTDELKWEDLAELNRIESKYSGNVPYFTPEQIHLAREFSRQCRAIAVQQARQLSH